MEGLSAVVAGSGNSWAGRAKVRFYLKWRDSALLSMEVEAVGRRRAEGVRFLYFVLYCIQYSVTFPPLIYHIYCKIQGVATFFWK